MVAEAFHKKDWVENEDSLATVQLVRTNVDEGYRGFHNGIPKYFMSKDFDMDEKKALALEWHLFGKTQYNFRLPRKRINLGDYTHLPTGVKFDPDRQSKHFRAYHPC